MDEIPETDAAVFAFARSKAAAEISGKKYNKKSKSFYKKYNNLDKTENRDPKDFSKILENFVKERGWNTPISIGAVLGRWEKIVGTDIYAHAKPEAFENNELVIRCDATAWAVQLRLLSPKILAKLEEELGTNVITKIIIKGPYAPSWRKGPRHVKGQGPRDTYG